MDYKKIYKNLYKKAKNRGAVKTMKNMEFHHFIPKSLYYSKYKAKIMKILDIKFKNNDDKINIYPLTLKEHYIAHLILFRLFPELTEIMFGLNQVMNRYGNSNKYIDFKKKIHKIISENNKNMVSCKDKDTGETFYVPSEEFYKNEKLVGSNVGTSANTKEYKCICGKIIKGGANYSMHKRHYCELGPKMPKEKKYTNCQYCNKKIINERLKRHEKACDENPNKQKMKYNCKIIKCEFCGKEGTKNIINRHIKYECKKNINRIDKKVPDKKECPYCKKLINPRGLYKHKIKCKKEIEMIKIGDTNEKF